MTSFFANPDEESLVEFDDGTKVRLRKYADAGIQEDLDAEMIRVTIKGGEDKPSEAAVRSGNLKFIQMMTKSIELPDGKVLTAPIGMGTFRKLSREAYARLLDEVFEHNAPLTSLRKQDQESLTE